jgi:hypothetical protein
MCRVWNVSLVVLGSTFLVLLLSPGTVDAQVCFRGHPRPRCGGFTVLEFTGGARLSQATVSASGQSDIYLAWSAGYLHNVGARSALGAAFKLSADDDGSRYGAALRYRRWLGPTWSLDLAPGVLLGGSENFRSLKFPSATADFAINWGDRVSVILGIDQLKYQVGTGRWEAHVGLRFGSWLAPLATLGLGVLAGATYND